jgi:hypothetical protein
VSVSERETDPQEDPGESFPPEETEPIEIEVNRTVQTLLGHVEADPLIHAILGARAPTTPPPAVKRHMDRLQSCQHTGEMLRSFADGLACSVSVAAEANGLDPALPVPTASRRLAQQGRIEMRTANAIGRLYELTSDRSLQAASRNATIDVRSVGRLSTEGPRVLWAVGAMGGRSERSGRFGRVR